MPSLVARIVQLQWGRGSRAAEANDLLSRHWRAVASMGPRLASRGGGIAAADQAAWGELQWGRGSRAAEARRRRERRTMRSSFNGAAAREPRRPYAFGFPGMRRA